MSAEIEALKKELRTELSLMNEKEFRAFIEIADEERARRVPQAVLDGECKADVGTVRELVNALVAGLEGVINKERERDVAPLDAFMASINFVRVVIEDAEKRLKFNTMETKKAFRATACATLERSLFSRLMN